MNEVFYFSGTGNSLAVAKRVAESLGDCELTAITREFCERMDAAAERKFDNMIVIFPSYAYGLPALVREFLAEFRFVSNYLALCVTCGSSAGGSLSSACGILRKRGIAADLCFTIQTVENFLPIFGDAGEQTVARRLSQQNARTEELIEAIRERKRNKVLRFRPVSAMVSGLFRVATPLIARGIKVSDVCNQCGLCARVCPAGAIRIEEGQIGGQKPLIDKQRCNQCQACLNLCPKRALSMWRHKNRCPQYRHPDVTPGEWLKR